MCTAFASAQWLILRGGSSWKPSMGGRVAHSFLRGDTEPGHAGNRLAVVYAKRQPAQSGRAFVRAPAGPSCTRWTLDCVSRRSSVSRYVLREARTASAKAPRRYGPFLKSGISWIRGALSKANISRMHIRQTNSNPPSLRSTGISRARRPLPLNPLPFHDVQTTCRSPGLSSSLQGPPASVRACATSERLPP